MRSRIWLVVAVMVAASMSGVAGAEEQSVSLDVDVNYVPLGPDYGGVQTEMVEGTYEVTVASNYELGPFNMACDKAIVYALTKGHPDSWVWVVAEGESQTLVLEDDSYSGDLITVNCFLPEGSDNTGDNFGGAILTFTGPETYTVELNGVTDTVALLETPGAYRNHVYECELTCWTATSSYSMGPGLNCNKVLLWISTFGDPQGWVWALTAGETECLSTVEYNYPDVAYTPMALILPEGSDNVGDNSGSVVVTTAIPPGCAPVANEDMSWGDLKTGYGAQDVRSPND